MLVGVNHVVVCCHVVPGGTEGSACQEGLMFLQLRLAV